MIFRFMNSQNAKRTRGPEETIFVDLNGEKDDPFGFSQSMRESKYLKVKKEDCTDISDLGPDLPNGNINWDCSCMGSQPFGPCGEDYRTIMQCMRDHEHEREEIQIEKCGLFRMAWQSCMEVHWQKYYPIAATRKQRSQKDKN